MRAPAVESRLDEILGGIVGAVQADEADVRWTIRFLQESDRQISYRGALKARTPFRGNAAENIDDYRALRKQFNGLQKQFKKMSSPALIQFFAFEDSGADEYPPHTIQQKALHRLRHFTRRLHSFRRVVMFLSPNVPARTDAVTTGNTGSQKRLGGC